MGLKACRKQAGKSPIVLHEKKNGSGKKQSQMSPVTLNYELGYIVPTDLSKFLFIYLFIYLLFFGVFVCFSAVQHGDQVTHTCIHTFSSHCCVAM